MRSIFRDFSEEFFQILTYPKEDWFEFWKEYKKNHPRIFEEYLIKHSLTEEEEKKRLKSLERRSLDMLRQNWQQCQQKVKQHVIKSIDELSDKLELSREDFVVFVMGALGYERRMFVPTSVGHVIMVDLVGNLQRGNLENLGEFIIESMLEFRRFSELEVTLEMPVEERKRRFEKLFNVISEKIREKEFDEKLKTIVKLLDHYVTYYNWTGFYLTDEDEATLLLGPFVGEPTEHVRIKFGQGICGQAAEKKALFLVPDVSREANYLSCSPKTKSEIVVPILKGNKVIGELDIDSHSIGAFTDADSEFLEKICQLLVDNQ